MKRITSIDLLKSGQVLGADAVGADGALLAAAGTELDIQLISQLRGAALTTVMIDLSEADVRELVSAQPDVDELETLFVFNDQSQPLVKKIVEVARELRN